MRACVKSTCRIAGYSLACIGKIAAFQMEICKNRIRLPVMLRLPKKVFNWNFRRIGFFGLERHGIIYPGVHKSALIW